MSPSRVITFTPDVGLLIDLYAIAFDAEIYL